MYVPDLTNSQVNSNLNPGNIDQTSLKCKAKCKIDCVIEVTDNLFY